MKKTVKRAHGSDYGTKVDAGEVAVVFLIMMMMMMMIKMKIITMLIKTYICFAFFDFRHNVINAVILLEVTRMQAVVGHTHAGGDAGHKQSRK